MDPFIDISNTTIESERLILRYWQMGDLSDFYEYASVPGVGEMAGWKHHESMEESKKILFSLYVIRKCKNSEWQRLIVKNLLYIRK